MKNATKSWLASLAINTIVLWEQEEGHWGQAAVVTIDSDGPATADSPIEIQPEFGSTTIVRAGDLRPATVAKVTVTIEIEAMLGQTSIAAFAEMLRGNIDSAASQGLLTADTDASVEKHNIVVSASDAEVLFTEEQRKDVWEALTDNDYTYSIAREGHSPRYESFTDTELMKGHRDQLGSLAGRFDWAKDGQFDKKSDEDDDE